MGSTGSSRLLITEKDDTKGASGGQSIVPFPTHSVIFDGTAVTAI
eukprot:NODE_4355_length_346_cov_29.946128_g3912_i0.p3 GENE.NODE_4355_length_346_cov_29.946128_g3912_i0~~NODE_4355_length_346_cov_29.946128_g3912_i0.p3  ORF type:complete len:55 (+),score=30.86 NODE_4355_length_346_cov_29.946128_g3912_i0:31-165(+)